MTPTYQLRNHLLSALLCLAVALAVGGEARAQSATEAVADPTMTLFDAVHANDMAAVQASVMAGADVEARDRWGMTPIEIAIDRDYFEICHYLMSVRNFQAAAAAESTSASRPGGVPGQMELASNSQAIPAGETATGVAAFESNAGPGASETAFDASPAVAWPADKPNPFDPSAPAHGAGKLIANDIGLTNLDDPFAPQNPPRGGAAPAAE